MEPLGLPVALTFSSADRISFTTSFTVCSIRRPSIAFASCETSCPMNGVGRKSLQNSRAAWRPSQNWDMSKHSWIAGLSNSFFSFVRSRASVSIGGRICDTWEFNSPSELFTFMSESVGFDCSAGVLIIVILLLWSQSVRLSWTLH